MNKKPCTIDDRPLTIRGAKDGYLMDRQYEYSLVGYSDYHGFLSHHTGECAHPMAEKRIN